jgi:hypothetical protein
MPVIPATQEVKIRARPAREKACYFSEKTY